MITGSVGMQLSSLARCLNCGASPAGIRFALVLPARWAEFGLQRTASQFYFCRRVEIVPQLQQSGVGRRHTRAASLDPSLGRLLPPGSRGPAKSGIAGSLAEGTADLPP